MGALARHPRYQGGGSSRVVPTRVDDAWTELHRVLGARVSDAPGHSDSWAPPGRGRHGHECADRRQRWPRKVSPLMAPCSRMLADRRPPPTSRCSSSGCPRPRDRRAGTDPTCARRRPTSGSSRPWLGPTRRLSWCWPAGRRSRCRGRIGCPPSSRAISGVRPVAAPWPGCSPGSPIPAAGWPRRSRCAGRKPGLAAAHRAGPGRVPGGQVRRLPLLRHGRRGRAVPLRPRPGLHDLRVRRGGSVACDPAAPQVVVGVRVANVGPQPGWEVVRVYVPAEEAAVPSPQQQLGGFAKVWLEPGEARARWTWPWTAAPSPTGMSGGVLGRRPRAGARSGSARRDIRGTLAVDLPGDGTAPPAVARGAGGPPRPGPGPGPRPGRLRGAAGCRPGPGAGA
jgi:hypothetical protein